jgi:DNA-binding transcriptional regulator YbjK
MAKAVIQPFENFVKARIKFVQKVARYADEKGNIEKLKALGALLLLKHLLKDRVESIRQSAALTLGKMAREVEDVAEKIVSEGMIPIVVASMKDANVICALNSHRNIIKMQLHYCSKVYANTQEIMTWLKL